MSTGAGNLRDKITIQQSLTQARDEFGGAAAEWTTLARPFAEIAAANVSEMDIAKSFAATVSHKIRIRFRTDVTTTMRIVFGSRVFSINGAIDPDQRRQWLDIFATELVT